MPEPIDAFLNIAKKSNVDKTLMKSSFVENTLDKMESYGKDLEEKINNLSKKTPLKPIGPTPTYKESAFLSPERESTLYNVTNLEDEVPFVEKASKFIKNLKFGIQSFNLSTTYTKEKNNYTLITGEKIGFSLSKTENLRNTGIKGTYNIKNKKSSIEYYSKNPAYSYNVSIYNQADNNGIHAKYRNYDGFNASISVDKNSSSLSCGYKKEQKDCNISLGGYITSGENYSDPFIGVYSRITF